MSLEFLIEPITADEDKSSGGFDDSPVEPGEYPMEFMAFNGRVAKESKKIYVSCRLAHTGPLKSKGSVFMNINNNEIGKRQFTSLAKAALGSAEGIQYGVDPESADEKGNLKASIMKLSSDGVEDITNSFFGKTLTVALKVGEKGRNEVRYIVVPKA